MKHTDVRGIGMTSQRTRDRMIQRLQEKGIKNLKLLIAMREVPRHLFVDEALASRAYEDSALPIVAGQTISQPYIVARMTELLLETPNLKRVLEVGTGSGYQCAVLAHLLQDVFSVERIERLHLLAKQRLQKLGYRNVRLTHADGGVGWERNAPYDAIMVTAAADEVPDTLLQQLKVGGRMIVPVAIDGSRQELQVITKTEAGVSHEVVEQVVFVPMLSGAVK